jgi:hypothetical protein
VIYIEHHDGSEDIDIGRIEWEPGWYAICDDCGWSAGPCLTEAEAIEAADQHAVAMGEATAQELERSERPAEAGELCTCGRQAIVVYLGSVLGPTGYCGVPDGGDHSRPCPFCGGSHHREPEGRCPDYRLQLNQP